MNDRQVKILLLRGDIVTHDNGFININDNKAPSESTRRSGLAADNHARIVHLWRDASRLKSLNLLN